MDPIAAAKIATALDRMERGLLGDVKPVGNGVSERRLHFGPGYRIYFGTLGRNGAATLLVLFHGGTKRNQANDVKTAKAYWEIYRRRMREGSSEWHSLAISEKCSMNAPGEIRSFA